MNATDPIDPDDDPEHLPPGTVVGEYILDEVLGVGGFARVYQAHHAVLSSWVAVKVISRALALDADASQRFVREALAASKIAHPGIVGVLGFGKLADGRAYQVMELIEGPALDDHLETVGRLPLPEALRILDAIAAALDAAHAAGIVHRDLKPANVLMAPGPHGLTPRLADFGIAKAVEGEDNPHLTRTGTTLGTPMYMSPEQALGRQVGPASDVYSFGVLAFQLITGRLPFTGDSPLETMMHHVQTEPPAASTVAPELGARFDAALAALLAKNPATRPPSLAEALRSLRAGAALARPHRGPRIGIAAAAVVAIGVAAALWWWRSSSPTAASPPAIPTVTPLTVTPSASTPPPSAPPPSAPPPSASPSAGSTVGAPLRPPAADPAPAPASRVPRPARAGSAVRPLAPTAEAAPALTGPTGADSIETPTDYEP